MAAKTSSRGQPKYKTQYRVRNWAEYDRSLTNRGDITVWFDGDAVAAAQTSDCSGAGACPT